MPKKRTIVPSAKKRRNVKAKHGINLKASTYKGARWMQGRPTGNHRGKRGNKWRMR